MLACCNPHRNALLMPAEEAEAEVGIFEHWEGAGQGGGGGVRTLHIRIATGAKGDPGVAGGVSGGGVQQHGRQAPLPPARRHRLHRPRRQPAEDLLSCSGAIVWTLLGLLGARWQETARCRLRESEKEKEKKEPNQNQKPSTRAARRGRRPTSTSAPQEVADA